nr:unnamed protein product [Callosobruchus analis]
MIETLQVNALKQNHYVPVSLDSSFKKHLAGSVRRDNYFIPIPILHSNDSHSDIQNPGLCTLIEENRSNSSANSYDVNESPIPSSFSESNRGSCSSSNDYTSSNTGDDYQQNPDSFSAGRFFFCAPVWLNSCHTKVVDVQLNNTMRLISGAVRPTPTYWLPLLSNLYPPQVRQTGALVKEFRKLQQNPNIPLHDDIPTLRKNRLRSRKPPLWKAEQLVFEEFVPSSI